MNNYEVVVIVYNSEYTFKRQHNLQVDSLEEGKRIGLNILKIVAGEFNRSVDDFYTDEDICYTFNINITSKHKQSFNTCKEVMEYYDNNIDNISNNDLYDFLLSLVDENIRHYSYTGELLENELFPVELKENVFSYTLDFDINYIKSGYYRFEYGPNNPDRKHNAFYYIGKPNLMQ